MPIKTELRLKVGAEKVVTGYICNVCGEDVPDEMGWVSNSDCHTIKLTGWYGSSFPGDMDTITFVVCSPCLEKWADTFKIPVEVEGWNDRLKSVSIMSLTPGSHPDILWWWEDDDILYHTEDEARKEMADDTLYESLPETEQVYVGVYYTSTGPVEVVGQAFLRDQDGEWLPIVIGRRLPGDGSLIGWHQVLWDAADTTLLTEKHLPEE